MGPMTLPREHGSTLSTTSTSGPQAPPSSNASRLGGERTLRLTSLGERVAALLVSEQSGGPEPERR
jgi:hypothetical protein